PHRPPDAGHGRDRNDPRPPFGRARDARARADGGERARDDRIGDRSRRRRYLLKGCPAEDVRKAVRTVVFGGAALTPGVARSVLDEYVAMAEAQRARDLALIRVLANSVERRDETTGNHASNVARLSLELLRAMTAAEPEDDLVYGFLLHDVR